MPKNPWYTDGLVWTVLGFIAFGILIGFTAGHYLFPGG